MQQRLNKIQHQEAKQKAEAERISSEAQGVINNGDATAEEIRDEKAKVEEALTQLTEAKMH